MPVAKKAKAEMYETKTCKFLASLALVAGILFLLRDFGVWNFWNLSWYTVGYILAGLAFIFGFNK